MHIQWRGTPVAIVDTDPASSDDVELQLYSSYMDVWWSDPDETAELANTEMATLFVSFKGSLMRWVLYSPVIGCSAAHTMFDIANCCQDGQMLSLHVAYGGWSNCSWIYLGNFAQQPCCVKLEQHVKCVAASAEWLAVRGLSSPASRTWPRHLRHCLCRPAAAT